MAILKHRGWRFQNATPASIIRPQNTRYYGGIGYHGGRQALCIFSMVVKWKILKCEIYWKMEIVERKGWKCETHGHMNCICRVLFISDSLSSIWSQLESFCALWNTWPYGAVFQNAILPTVFIRSRPTFKRTLAGGIKSVTFGGNRPSFIYFVALWSFNIGVNGKNPNMCNILK